MAPALRGTNLSGARFVRFEGVAPELARRPLLLLEGVVRLRLTRRVDCVLLLLDLLLKNYKNTL